jgi:hypothetical protein
MRRVLALLVLSATGVLAALPVRVTIVTLGPETTAAPIAAELRKLDGVEVRQAKGKLPEGRKESELTNEDRKALGGETAAILLLILSEKGDAFGYVDAATGEELFRIREETPEDLARSAGLLVEELRDTEKAEPSPSPGKEKPGK